jgi:hypothetical protein
VSTKPRNVSKPAKGKRLIKVLPKSRKGNGKKADALVFNTRLDRKFITIETLNMRM